MTSSKADVPPRRHRRSTHWGALGLPVATALDVVSELDRGFPYSALLRFERTSGLSLARIAQLIRIPRRTLLRRKATGRLLPDESERLLRVAGVFEKAVGLFGGDVAAARRWLGAPRGELGNVPPIEFARTDVGAREVEDLIGRLEHGVFT